MRQCGDCQLCCSVLPVRELNKPANTRCPHQRFHKGCNNYARRPAPCKLWNCVWLTGKDTGDMRRPDRVHYVVDIVPDFIKIRDDQTGEMTAFEVIQVWVDPKHPNAHRDPALRAYLERRAQEGKLALVRSASEQGMVLVAPIFNKDREWVECTSEYREPQHSAAEVYATLQAMREAV